MTGSRSCMNAGGKPKVRYDTRRDAKEAIARRVELDEARPYRCPICRYFHIGHYPTEPGARQRLRSRHRRSER